MEIKSKVDYMHFRLSMRLRGNQVIVHVIVYANLKVKRKIL